MSVTKPVIVIKKIYKVKFRFLPSFDFMQYSQIISQRECFEISLRWAKKMILITLDVWHVTKFVCQVPQISGRFPFSLARFSRILWKLSEKKPFNLGCLRGISLYYCESIFLAPLCNYLLLMAVSLETNQRILFCSDTHEDHK